MNNIECLANDVINKYSTLSAKSTESGITLYGILILNAEYNDIPLYDEYEIEVDIPQEFPESLPKVREVSNRIPQEFGHFLDDGSLCLAAMCELADFVASNGTIIGYIEKYVMSYLYAASYFSRYKEIPFGERTHGIVGIKEAYMERYNCDEEDVLISLLRVLVGLQRYRGHDTCPCGSNKKLRECHGGRLLSDIQSELAEYYQYDACLLLKDYFERRVKNGRKNGKKSTTRKLF